MTNSEVPDQPMHMHRLILAFAVNIKHKRSYLTFVIIFLNWKTKIRTINNGYVSVSLTFGWFARARKAQEFCNGNSF